MSAKHLAVALICAASMSLAPVGDQSSAATCHTPGSIVLHETPSELTRTRIDVSTALDASLRAGAHDVGTIDFGAPIRQGAFDAPTPGMTWWRIRHTLDLRIDAPLAADARVRILPKIRGFATIQAIVEPSASGGGQLRLLDTDSGTQVVPLGTEAGCVSLTTEAYLVNDAIAPGPSPLTVAVEPYVGAAEVVGRVSIRDVQLIESVEFPGGFRLDDLIYRAVGSDQAELGVRVMPYLPKPDGNVTVRVQPLQPGVDERCDALSAETTTVLRSEPVSVAVPFAPRAGRSSCRLQVSARGQRDQQYASLAVDVDVRTGDDGMTARSTLLPAGLIVAGAALLAPRWRKPTNGPRSPGARRSQAEELPSPSNREGSVADGPVRRVGRRRA